MTANKNKKVEQLWTLVANDLIDRLENGEEIAEVAETSDGPVVSRQRVRPKAQTLAVAIKFLKDNEVKVPEGNPTSDRLSKMLADAKQELDAELGSLN